MFARLRRGGAWMLTSCLVGAILVAPPVVGALLLDYILWLGILIMAVWFIGIFGFVSYVVGALVEDV